MLRLLLPATVLLAGACAGPAVETLQPRAAALSTPVYLYDVDLSLGPNARREVAQSDAKIVAKAAADYAGMPFKTLLRRMFEEGAAERGFTAGRAVTVAVELDHLRVPSAAGSLGGRHDRLAGLVRLTDSRTGAALGTFYVDVDRHYPGLIGLAVREGNGSVRERLVSAFVRHTLDQIAPAPRR